MWIDFSQGIPDIDNLKRRFFENWQQAIFSFLEQWYNDDPFVLTFTSGTTGKPSAISIKKEYMRNSAHMSGRFFKLTRGDTALLCLSSEYIASKMMLVRSAVLGLRIYCVAPCSRPLQKVGSFFDFAAMVPFQIPGSFSDLHHINKLLIGGAPLTLPMENLLNKVNTACYASYAMTETLSHIALRRVNGPFQSQWYKTLPGVHIETDQRGCLKIFSSFLMDYPLQTNDMVDLKPPDHFRWLGRFDYLINSGGIKIIPEQWEAKLQKFIPRRFFLSSWFDEVLGEKVIIVIEGERFDIKLPDHLFKGKDRFCKPKEAYFVSSFVETSSGKIQRRETLNQLTL